MGKVKRILLVGPQPPPYGGWSHVVSSLAASPFNDVFEIVTYDTRLRDTVIDKNKLQFSARAFSQIVHFRKAVEQCQPDVTIIFTGPGLSFWRDMFLLNQCRRLNLPVLVRFFGGVITTKLLKLPSLLRLWVASEMSRCRAALVETYSMQEDWKNLCPGVPVYRVPNFIRLNGLPIRSDHTNPLRLLYLGNMTPSKGVEIVLKSVNEVSDVHPGVEFHFIGGEIEKGYLDQFRTQVSHLRHADVVHIHGTLPHRQAMELLSTGEIFLFPTRWLGEGQPAALLEAMGIGLVPIGTQWRGVAEIVQHGINGILLDENDTMASAILRLIENPELRTNLGNMARRTVQTEYSAEAALSQFQQILKEVC